MKRRVLGKTTSFHALEKKQNSADLDGIVLLFPLDTQRQGKKKFLSPATPLSPSPLAQILTRLTPLICHHDKD